MAWIELHDTLHDHEKTRKAAKLLKMNIDEFVGKIERLWLWALNHRENGLIELGEEPLIARVMNYRGGAQKLVNALVEARWLDVEGNNYVIHNWFSKVSRLMESRERRKEQVRLAQQRYRDKQKQDDNINDDEREIEIVEEVKEIEIPEISQSVERGERAERTERVERVEVSAKGGGYLHDTTTIDALHSYILHEWDDSYITGHTEKLLREAVLETSFAPDDFDISLLVSHARKKGMELMVGEAVLAAGMAKATSPTVYAKRCLDSWAQYNIDTPKRLEAARPYLAVLSSSSNASPSAKDDARYQLDRRGESYENDRYAKNLYFKIQDLERQIRLGFVKAEPGHKPMSAAK